MELKYYVPHNVWQGAEPSEQANCSNAVVSCNASRKVFDAAPFGVAWLPALPGAR